MSEGKQAQAGIQEGIHAWVHAQDAGGQEGGRCLTERPELTQERLRALLRYDPDTGLFTWIERRNQFALAGSIAGSPNDKGHIQIRIDGVKHYVQRLAWLYMMGVWPDGDVDHINGAEKDNRWSNLRDVSHSVNLQNQRAAMSNNSTGLLGVSRNNKGFIARINVNGEKRYLGFFKDKNQAHLAYLSAKRLCHEGNTL